MAPKGKTSSAAPAALKIVQLAPEMKRITVNGTITAMAQPRDLQTKFGPGQVCEATLKDDTGTIALTLWNENIGKVHVGSNLHIENAYTSTFKEKLQLNLGQYGRMTVVE